MRLVCALAFLELTCGLYLSDDGAKNAEDFVWKGDDGGAWEQNGTILDGFLNFVDGIKRQNGLGNAMGDENGAKIKPATDVDENRELVDDFRRKLDEMKKKIGGKSIQMLSERRRVVVDDVRGNSLEKDKKGADIPERPPPRRPTRAVSQKSTQTPDKPKHTNIDDHLSEIKEEVKKLQDLVQILRDQQYILSLLADPEKDTNPKPKTSNAENSSDSRPKIETSSQKPRNQTPPSVDLDAVKSEIDDLKNLIKNNLLKKLESDERNEKIDEEKLSKELEEQKREILYLKKMITKFSKSNESTSLKSRTTEGEGESTDEIENVLKTVGDIQEKLSRFIERKSNSLGELINTKKISSLESNDIVGAAKSDDDDLFESDDATNRLKRLEKELKLMAKSQSDDDGDANDLSSLFKQVGDDEDEDPDLKEMLRNLQKQVDKNKKHERSDTLKRLEKMIEVSEGKKKGNDEKQIMIMLKRLQKHGKSLDDEDDASTRLKHLEEAINKLKPKENEDEPRDDNFEAMLEKLVSQENVQINPIISKTKKKLTRKQMVNLTKKLEAMVDNQGEEIAEVPKHGCDHNRYQNGFDTSGKQFTDFRYIDNYNGGFFGNANNQFGYPSGNQQQQWFGPVQFPHYNQNQYRPSYPRAPNNFYPNFPNQNNPYFKQPNQVPIQPSGKILRPDGFFQTFHNYGQKTGHEELPAEAYKSNANFDQTNPPQYQINPQQNSQNGDLYANQRIGDLKNQIYDLQNVINTLNQPEYVKKPEDKVAIYNLDKQITDLKSVVNNLGLHDDKNYASNFPAQNYPSQTKAQQPVQNYHVEDSPGQIPQQDLNKYQFYQNQKIDGQKSEDVDDQKQNFDYTAQNADYQSVDQNQAQKYERSSGKSKKQKRSLKSDDENILTNLTNIKNFIDSSLKIILKRRNDTKMELDRNTNEITKEGDAHNSKNSVSKPHANLFDELSSFFQKTFKNFANFPKIRSERDVDEPKDLSSILADFFDAKSNEIDDDDDQSDETKTELGDVREAESQRQRSYQPNFTGIRKGKKKVTKIEKILDKLINKVIDSTIRSIPRATRTIFYQLFGYGSDYSNQNAYALQNYQSGLIGQLPMILLKVLSNLSYFVSQLQRSKFIRNFLVPSLVLVAVPGLIAFLIWWLQPNDYQQSYSIADQNYNNYNTNGYQSPNINQNGYSNYDVNRYNYGNRYKNYGSDNYRSNANDKYTESYDVSRINQYNDNYSPYNGEQSYASNPYYNSFYHKPKMYQLT